MKHTTKAKGVEPPKPRNFVAKNAINTGAGAHKDKKKAVKQGDVKHKHKEIAETSEHKLSLMLEMASVQSQINELKQSTKDSYKKKATDQVKELEPHAKDGEYKDLAQRAIDRRKKGLARVAEGDPNAPYTPSPAKPFRNPKGFNKQGTGVGNKLAQQTRAELAKKKEQGVAEGAPIVVMPSHKRLEKKHKPSLSRGMDPAKAQGEQDARDGKPYNNPYPFKKELGAPGNWEHNSYKASYDSVKKGVAEEKQRLDPKCWSGKHKEGTKIKGGVRVNNCVPVSEDVENIMAVLIDRLIVNEAISYNQRRS